ncbi:segregation and condensation protein A [Criblamydia sequanensis]|uniref:Segregation and condensation protein A n=1 Tax=Candidatus Criblamydia sequanensis CRIB-18 TaxID=1437425 RepID=A0A090E2C1_9BACT|nr:segregation/condensation protein A [Criblamydia sequanensis]CDR34804.1 Putative segregation and condensation protein A [Criblamydia sequanensis CRIB-18]
MTPSNLTASKNSDFYLTLEGFDGPLGVLLHLVQQKEIDIFDVRLSKIISLFIEEFKDLNLDVSSEFIGTFSQLVYFKSKTLLPDEIKPSEEELLNDPLDEKFEIIHKLIDYCLFKEAGKQLISLEEEQGKLYSRGLKSTGESPRPLGLNHLTLNDLASLFKTLLDNKEKNTQILYEEEWKVSDKIQFIKDLLLSDKKIPLFELFFKESSKLEWIVTFLAVLELMKIGKLSVFKEADNEVIFVSLT